MRRWRRDIERIGEEQGEENPKFNVDAYIPFLKRY